MMRGLHPLARALLVVAALVPRDAGGQPPAAECAVLAGNGESRATPSGPWQPLPRGSRPPPRGEIRAVDGPLRVCLARGAVVELAAGTLLSLQGETHVTLDGGAKIEAVDVRLEAGELLAEPIVKRWSGPLTRPLLVRAAGDVTALHIGGGLRARVVPGKGLAVAAYLGDALVSAGQVRRPLRSGAAVELRPGAPPAPSRPLLPAPAWATEDGPRAPGPLALVAADGAAPLSARFAPVPGASGYDAEIARDESFREVVARFTLAPGESTMTTRPLPAGRYFARLSARGAEGVPGLPGARRALRVVRVALPTGGGILGELVVLPPGRTLRFEDPDGLEIGRGGAFARLGGELGLDEGDKASSLRVRLAGDSVYLPLALAPLALRAELVLGPKTATWPNDPVWISVRILAPDASVVAYEPTLRVTVNMQEAPVSWVRERDGLRAQLPPRSGKGPWVVRAEARDQRGKELGFGALEVIAAR